MGLENKFIKDVMNGFGKLYRPLKNPKVSGGILLGAIIGAMPLSMDRYNIHTEINRTYLEAGGTNASLSPNEKVDYIHNQSLYNPTNSYNGFLNRVKPIKE